MEDNPYKPPVVDSAAVIDGLSISPIRVDGRFLVVQPGAVLPQICVRTAEKITEADMRRKRFEWCSPWVALSFLVSGCLMILLYFVLRKQCEIVFGMHPSLRKRYRLILTFKLLAVVGLFCLMPVMAIFESPAPIVIVVIAFIVAIVALFFGNSPLSVAKYHDGEFWLKGCSPEFLQHISRSVFLA